MKKLLLVTLLACFLFSCIEQQRIRTRDRVVIDGDEIPGIGADKIKPDTCYAYYNQRDHRIHISYGNIKTLDTVLKH